MPYEATSRSAAASSLASRLRARCRRSRTAPREQPSNLGDLSVVEPFPADQRQQFPITGRQPPERPARRAAVPTGYRARPGGEFLAQPYGQRRPPLLGAESRHAT